MGDGSQDGGALGIARKGSVVAHVVRLDTEAAHQMLQAGASLVTNPRSNMAYGAGLCGASGTSVALGTDGLSARASFRGILTKSLELDPSASSSPSKAVTT